jgi:hypothetical protein
LKKSCWLNLAAAYLKQGEFVKAAAECTKVRPVGGVCVGDLYTPGWRMLLEGQGMGHF